MDVRLAKISMHDPVLRHLRYDFVQINQNLTVGQALATIRNNPTVGQIIYFYVVDHEGRLTGVVPTRRLLLERAETPVADIMVRDVITIPETATVLDACELFTLHRLLALPDRRRQAPHPRHRRCPALHRRAQRAGRYAAHRRPVPAHRCPSDRSRSNPGHLVAFGSRFPWLICNIVGGILAAFISGAFEAELEKLVALAMFVPVVLGLAESVAIQSVSLTLQILHGQTPTWPTIRGKLPPRTRHRPVARPSLRRLRRDRLLPLAPRPPPSPCLLGGIGGGVTAAALLGVAMPNILRLLNRNPQVAAGPIALASADMVTLLVYFSLARLIVHTG